MYSQQTLHTFRILRMARRIWRLRNGESVHSTNEDTNTNGVQAKADMNAFL